MDYPYKLVHRLKEEKRRNKEEQNGREAEQGDSTGPETEEELEEKTVRELKGIAEAQDIEVPARARKAEIIGLLRADK